MKKEQAIALATAPSPTLGTGGMMGSPALSQGRDVNLRAVFRLVLLITCPHQRHGEMGRAHPACRANAACSSKAAKSFCSNFTITRF
jgi:hypothetical protein